MNALGYGAAVMSIWSMQAAAAAAQPAISVSDATVVEGDTGSTELVFTLSLSEPLTSVAGITYRVTAGTATEYGDFLGGANTFTLLPGGPLPVIRTRVIGDNFPEADETFTVTLSQPSGVTIADGQGIGTITDDDGQPTYYFAEGATGSFFDFDIALANPHAVAAHITLTFLLPDGEAPIVVSRTLAPTSRTTIRVDEIAGLEARSGMSTVITSVDGLPLVADQMMRWSELHYGGHAGRANTAPSLTWYFAEGVQNGATPQTGGLPYFDTFLMLANTSPSPAEATVRFLLEPSGIVTKTYQLGPSSRTTVYAGAIPEVVGRSFAMEVTSTAPIFAERSTYFGAARLWDGGHRSTGVRAPATAWIFAEGATGPFFETFLAIANPGATETGVQINYSTPSGLVFSSTKTVPAGARLTVNVEQEHALLANAAVSMNVYSLFAPIVAERITYWPDPATSWSEAHSSFGETIVGVKWGLAEGRVGGPEPSETYLMLHNSLIDTSNITATFFRTGGAAPVVKTFSIPPGRFTLNVNSMVPELANEEFSTQIAVTSGPPINVEGAIYWDALGVPFAGGVAIAATRLP